MLRLVAGIGVFVLLLAAVPISYIALENACSLQHSRNDKNAKSANGSDDHTSPKGKQTTPTATFNLSITEPGKIDGRYYAKEAEREKEDWSYKFWCDAKIGEFALVVFTFFLVVFTGGLWWSTHRLWKAGESQIEVAKISAEAARISALVARKTLLQANQPIIGLSHVSVNEPTASRPHVHISFNITNAGNSAALMDRLTIEISVDLPRENSRLRRSDTIDEEWNATIPPHSTGSPNVINAPGLTDHDISAIRNSFGKIALYFMMFFTDPLGTKYTAGFPFIFDVGRKSLIRTTAASWESYTGLSVPEYISAAMTAVSNQKD